MQTFQITVEDSVSDKVLWFLNNLKEYVTVEEIETGKEKVLKSIESGIKEAKMIHSGELKSQGSLEDFIKELDNEN